MAAGGLALYDDKLAGLTKTIDRVVTEHGVDVIAFQEVRSDETIRAILGAHAGAFDSCVASHTGFQTVGFAWRKATTSTPGQCTPEPSLAIKEKPSDPASPRTLRPGVALKLTIGGTPVTNTGCHHVDGTCFVTLDGAPFGTNEGCAQGTSFNQFRFDNADTTNGRRTYASLLAAYLSGRRVTIAINDRSSQGVPTLSYYHVHDRRRTSGDSREEVAIGMRNNCMVGFGKSGTAFLVCAAPAQPAPAWAGRYMCKGKGDQVTRDKSGNVWASFTFQGGSMAWQLLCNLNDSTPSPLRRASPS